MSINGKNKIEILIIICCCLFNISEAQKSITEISHERTIKWETRSDFSNEVYKSFAEKHFTQENLSGKGNVTRILFAKLLLKQDIEEVNRTIVQIPVWGVVGTNWALNKNGDYDFTITPLTTILFMFGDKPEIIYPATKDYLLNVLLTEEGNNFRTSAPNSLGMVPETENHILMTEGSRYLKNRWKMLHGDTDKKYDNEQNGMETKLLNFINKMKQNGLYEFNSIPYIGYTIAALLNLEAYGSEKIRLISRDVLDYMNWTYALGSYRLKHYPPMRRRYEKASITSLTTDYQSAFIKSWLSFSTVKQFDKNLQNGGDAHALMGAGMPYRPADQVVQMLFDKGDGYFVKLGHGKNSCPEIFTAGKNYLLSAGGANQGELSVVVARPTCLFLNDTVSDLSGIFHLAGPGNDFKKWNNTGVYNSFACAAGPVFIPSNFKPVIKQGNWSLFTVKGGISVVTYSTDLLGLLVVFDNNTNKNLLDKVIAANPDESLLNTAFHFPDGHGITYDVNAAKGKWVIKSFNTTNVERDFSVWPLIE